MEILINKELLEKIQNGNITSRHMIEYVLSNCDYKLHFKIKDIKGELTKENVYNQLSLEKLYNDKEQNVKRAYIKDNKIILEL